jgi:RNA polymerase sigma-70 factor (ECF subfamily)
LEKLIKKLKLEKSEIKLLERIKKDDAHAFDSIFRKYYQQLCFFSLKIVKKSETAEEIVQDLFVQFWEKRQCININISLKSYLYRSVHNNSVRQFKKDNLLESIDEKHGFANENFDDLLVQNETETKIYKTIEELPEQCRKIFKMSRFDELKYREIAEKLNISIKTVETQMSRALKYLTTNLKHLTKILILIFSQLI